MLYNMGIILSADTGNPISEFADKLFQHILGSEYQGSYILVEKSFQGLFDSLNQELSSASRQIGLGPRLWNSSAYSLMEMVAENVCIPIAGAFITIIFCWELLHLMQDSNAMQNVKPERLMFVLMKFCLCFIVCIHSFEIVMGLCDIGIWATKQISQTSVSVNMEAPSMEAIGLPAELPRYEFVDLLRMTGYLILINLAKVGVWICSLLVYVRIMIWFVEYLIYASVSPIPYSTWMNREWSQVGMNYTRKMLALSFEGFFILLLFALYGGVLGGLRAGDFVESLVMTLGCGFGLAVMMFKVGNISASIFNAH